MNVAERGPMTRFTGKVFFGFGPMDALGGKAYRLKGDLEKFPSVTKELRETWQEEMKTLPQFLSMNTQILSIALVILHKLEGEQKVHTDEGEIIIEVKDLRDQLDTYVDPQYPPDNEETANLGLRKKEDIFRYIRAIIGHRERSP